MTVHVWSTEGHPWMDHRVINRQSTIYSGIYAGDRPNLWCAHPLLCTQPDHGPHTYMYVHIHIRNHGSSTENPRTNTCFQSVGGHSVNEAYAILGLAWGVRGVSMHHKRFYTTMTSPPIFIRRRAREAQKGK